MALYKIYEPCEIDSVLIRVDPAQGREIEVTDDHVPSITWTPLDEPAKSAMEKLKQGRKLKQQAEFILSPERIRAKFMQEYLDSLKNGLVDPALSSYEEGAYKELLQDRDERKKDSKKSKKDSFVPSIETERKEPLDALDSQDNPA